ncbi:8-oxo-dGTP diphosphatase [Stackebrandtia albiflava]|uniref:8-oxo-dGTP diphosphatase n=1 Tax=Stackebrandtia albiflava TaxID=406432 RepID=A0A562VA29_9ACTN|nr:NUDIX hydrolase [Stackebrandtia albiflava]TWJ14736.1 8-oxo-dGTP diphosphatase [Stackebrandtia albiflava]
MPDPEETFLAEYDPAAFPPVAVTVDVVALTMREGVPVALLIRRGVPPFQGAWALPGGFVHADEDLATAALRELGEETRLPSDVHIEQLGGYGSPTRDPRMRVVSIAYLLLAADLPDPRPGTDAAEAAWVPLRELGFGTGGPTPRPLAFDHAAILADGVERARSKLEYTALATAFLPAEFTMAGLREVYEALWNVPLHAANFHRKVLSVPGFVVDTGRLTAQGGGRGGRRARLYRAGDATSLHPALLRPAGEES